MPMKFRMEGPPSEEERKRFRATTYSLIRDNDLGYAVFLQLMNIARISGKRPACIKVEHDETITLGINFDIFMRLSLAARRELLKHVILHIPFGHVGSRGQRLRKQYPPEVVDLAEDLVVDQVINAGILAIEGVIVPTPDLFGLPPDLTTEDYCQRILDNMKGGAGGGKQQQKGGSNSKQQQPGQGQGGMPQPDPKTMQQHRNGQGKDQQQTGYPLKSWGDPSQDQQQNEEALKNFQNPDGTTRPDESVTHDPEQQKATGSDTTMGQVDSAVKALLDKVDGSLRASKQSLKQQGWMRGEMEEYIKSLTREAKINWAAQLRRKEAKHWKRWRKVSHKRPSRRYPLYWGRIKKTAITVVVWVDTSGSMSRNELRVVNAEVKAMHNRGARVLVGFCDAGIAQEPKLYNPHTPLYKFAGRGGTDFRPAFDFLTRMNPQPDFVVYVTDGYGTAPETKYETDTLWVLTSTGMDKDEFQKRTCSWGDVAILDVADVGDDAEDEAA